VGFRPIENRLSRSSEGQEEHAGPGNSAVAEPGNTIRSNHGIVKPGGLR
jgi:hypothetical protein